MIRTNMIRIGRYEFDGPWLLNRVDLIDRACIYTVLCKGSNDKYVVLYVGETGEVGTRLSNHGRVNCWNRNCESSLYVAIFWTPSDRYTPQDRRKIEKELRDRYDPPCNRQ